MGSFLNNLKTFRNQINVGNVGFEQAVLMDKGLVKANRFRPKVEHKDCLRTELNSDYKQF